MGSRRMGLGEGIPQVITEQISDEVITLMASSEWRGTKAKGRPRVTVCKRGHDQAAEGARNKHGNCIACARARALAHYYAKKANS